MNPFLIGGQRDGEDRVTFALGVVLRAGGASLLESLLTDLGFNFPLQGGEVKIDCQVATVESRPDARFEVPGELVVVFENKVVPGTIDIPQLRNHLTAFSGVEAARRALLLIAPDAMPPRGEEWDAFVDDACNRSSAVDVCFAPWQEVSNWALRQSKSHSVGEVARYLLRTFVEFLQHEGVARMLDTRFDADRLRRIVGGAGQWLEDLRQEHAAQEAFLHEVAAALWPPLRAAVGRSEGPTFNIASRWHEPTCPTPVSSYLEFWLWNLYQLEELPHPRLWTEFALEDGRLWISTAVLLTGKAQVARWFEPLQTVAHRAFGESFWVWKHRAIKGQVYASRPFELERRDEIRDFVVADLLRWATEVLPRLKERRA